MGARSLFKVVAVLSLTAAVTLSSCGLVQEEKTARQLPPAPRELSFLACGDVLLARGPGRRAAEIGSRPLLEHVRGLVSGADIAFANLETPISERGKPYPGKPPGITFRADPDTLDGVAWAGFDVVSLANNHMNDHGPRALADTLEHLDAAGIARAGAGRDLEEASQPALIEVDGQLVAVLSYAEPVWSATVARSGARARVLTRVETRMTGQEPLWTSRDPDRASSSLAGLAPAYVKSMQADVRRVLATAKPEYLFVSVHWGDEYQPFPRAFQKTFGRAAIDAGATAVLGHHPHVLQGVEHYQNGLILYSLGNFVFDMAEDETYETAAFRFYLDKGRIRRLEAIPVRIARRLYAPAIAVGKDGRAILDKLAARSKPLGTALSIEGGIAFLDLD
ncbi:MAG: CapA family protein [Spirochaetales bacterium]|nr:CapA family protein [Spirochaetales bacterium]MBP7263103.1 CapA family protein [Spirochaetia bacterium]